MQVSHMPAMLMPAVNSYFAIYTLENMERTSQKKRGLNWDLHATATDKTMAISHARMLALQPGVSEVHVKQVTEDLTSGVVSVRDVKKCKRNNHDSYVIYSVFGLIAATCAVAARLLF